MRAHPAERLRRRPLDALDAAGVKILRPRPKGRCYPFDAPTKRRIQALYAVDPLLARMEALERKITMQFRWLIGIQVLTLALVALLANR